MYIFSCEDTTTTVMNYLSRKEIIPLLLKIMDIIHRELFNILLKML